MEEEKAAAYYDELTRKGEGAARFKQGLGFSSSHSSDSNKPLASSSTLSSSSFLSTFVKASCPNSSSELQKQSQLQSIQKKPESSSDSQSSTPAERVKAKMKFQLSETAAKDTTKSMGSGWERFEFNKDAPLDDEEVEGKMNSDVLEKENKITILPMWSLYGPCSTLNQILHVHGKMEMLFRGNIVAPTINPPFVSEAEDDAALVKHIGQTFRFSAVESRRKEDMQAAHDEAMFGAPKPSTLMAPFHSENEPEQEDCTNNGNESLATSLINDKVLAKQQGSWRDRARKV
ncbi:hypothetical protein RJ641_009234 [Dillenia turbinata]|uniref:Uncharacterized protein n=1 Tax=Dillenia turbinata TaxID=194707 RepID=A0AAN8UXP8_9MAGN